MKNCVSINRDKCIGCKKCVIDCPLNAIAMKDNKATMILDECMECGHCVAICPQAAITMKGYQMSEVKDFRPETFTIDSEVFLNTIKFRRSIRQYKNQEIERAKIQSIIEAGRFTPTGSNKQKIRYVVAEKPAEIEKDAIKIFKKIKIVTDFLASFIKLPIDTRRYNVQEGFFFHHANKVILVISKDETDAALASANMGTMAESLGLGVLYVGYFSQAAKFSRAIKKKLKIKGKEKVVTAIALGYPRVKYQRTVPRKQATINYI